MQIQRRHILKAASAAAGLATLGNNLLGQYRVFFDTAAQVMLLD